MRRSLQHPYTTSHTTAEARNPRILLTSRIPVLLLQVPRENAFDVVNPSADNTWKNAGPEKSHAMVVALKVISRNVARSQVTSQKILIDRISLHPQVQARWTLPVHYLRQKAEFFDEKGLLKEYRPPVQQQQQTGVMFALKKIPITSLTPSSVSVPDPDPDPAPVPSPDFPFQEFPLKEVVSQSQIDSSSISDTLVSRECSNFLRKATKSTDLPLEIRLEQQITRRNERKQRSHRIR